MTTPPQADRLKPARDLPAWLTLYVPVLVLVAIFGVRAFDHGLYRRVFDGELGVIELATPLLAFVAVAYGLALLRWAKPPRPWLRLWLLAITLGAFYFGGEELSWGQHLFGWATPDYLQALNDQQETNLHNMSSWLDQKPRLLLELWVLVGGVIMVLVRRAGAGEADRGDWRPWFWPGMACLPTAVICIAVRLPERLKGIFDLETLPLEIRYSEPQEFYFALFLLLYLGSLWRRSRAG